MKKFIKLLLIASFLIVNPFISGCSIIDKVKEVFNKDDKNENSNENEVNPHTIKENLVKYELYENDKIVYEGVEYTNSSIGLIGTKLVDTSLKDLYLTHRVYLSESSVIPEDCTLEINKEHFIKGYAPNFISNNTTIRSIKISLASQYFYNNCINNVPNLARIEFVEFDDKFEAEQTPFDLYETCDLIFSGDNFLDALFVFPSYYKQVSFNSPAALKVDAQFSFGSAEYGHVYSGFVSININLKIGDMVGDLMERSNFRNYRDTIYDRRDVLQYFSRIPLYRPFANKEYNVDYPEIKFSFECVVDQAEDYIENVLTKHHTTTYKTNEIFLDLNAFRGEIEVPLDDLKFYYSSGEKTTTIPAFTRFRILL